MPVIAEVGLGWSSSGLDATIFDLLEYEIALPSGVVLSRRRGSVGSIIHVRSVDLGRTQNQPSVNRAFLVDSTVQLDGSPTTEPIMFVFFSRRQELSPADFRAHWRDVHAPLARRHHVGMSRYIQHVVIDGTDTDVDAIAELHFPSTADFTDRFYDSEAGARAIAEDVVRFSGRRADTYLVRRRAADDLSLDRHP